MYDKKPTKNILTKELLLYGPKGKPKNTEKKKGSILSIFAIDILWIVAVAVISPVLYMGIIRHFNLGTGFLVVYILISVLLCVPPFLMIIWSIQAEIELKRNPNRSEEIYVVIDEVAYKEEIIEGHYRSRRLKQIIHLRRCGDVEVNSTWYQLTSNDDTYYVVLGDPNSNEPIAVYPTKLYEYRE